MRFSIDTTREVRNGLEKSGLSRLDLYYPAIFVPVIVDTEYEDEPWPYAETWVAFYFARPLIMSKGKGLTYGFFNAGLDLFADDYLTCYKKVAGDSDSGERYRKDIRELGITEIDSLWNDLVSDSSFAYNTILDGLTKSVSLYNEIFGETGEAEREQKLVDYRKVH